MRGIVLDGQLPIEGTALQERMVNRAIALTPVGESIRDGLLVIEKNADQ
jgi:hypothetical protein